MFQAERHALEAEATVRRWETEVETLRQRIQEDGLSVTREGDVFSPEIAVPRVPQWLSADQPDEGPGGLRPVSGGAGIDPAALGRDIERLRGERRRLGPGTAEAQGGHAGPRAR